MDENPNADSMHPLQGPHHRELTPPGPAAFAPLVLRVQPLQTQVVVNQPHAVIGRHSHADIRLAFPEISRRHCRVIFEDGQWRIVDLDSLNGVWVNGERMFDVPLYDGDHVKIGCCFLKVERGTPARVPALPSDPKAEVLQSIADVLPRQAG